MSPVAPDFAALRPRLEAALRPALRLSLVAARPTDALPVDAMRFGGTPYRETATWPSCRDCHRPLVFLGQVEPRDVLGPAPGFALATLYYCRRCRVRSSAVNGRGFFVETFASPSSTAHLPLAPDEEARFRALAESHDFESHVPCAARVDAFRSFPHWEDWEEWGLEALASISAREPPDAFVRAFRAWLRPLVVTRFGSSPDATTLFSYVGGHPYWANGNVEHRALGGRACACGRAARHLVQLDSEEAAGFSFGKGAGLLNVFVCASASDASGAACAEPFRFVHQMI